MATSRPIVNWQDRRGAVKVANTVHPPSPFEPRYWLANRHIQTVCAALPNVPVRRPAARLQHLLIDLPGGVERLHARALWLQGRRPAVILIHGVGGCSDSAYVRRAAAAMLRAGYHAVSLDLRGAGPGAALAQCIYHAGLTEDVDSTVRALLQRPEVDGVAVLGLSLGGQASLLTAAHWGAQAPVQAVVTVSAPFDLDVGCTLLDGRGWGVYRSYILSGQLKRVRRLAENGSHRLPIGVDDLKFIRRLRAFDDRVIAPMHGFHDATDYYAKVSCGPHLAAIHVPTLCIGAKDDPIVPFSTLQPYLPRAARSVTLAFSRYGGHLGFVGGIDGGVARSWAMDQATAFLRRVF